EVKIYFPAFTRARRAPGDRGGRGRGGSCAPDRSSRSESAAVRIAGRTGADFMRDCRFQGIRCRPGTAYGASAPRVHRAVRATGGGGGGRGGLVLHPTREFTQLAHRAERDGRRGVPGDVAHGTVPGASRLP